MFRLILSTTLVLFAVGFLCIGVLFAQSHLAEEERHLPGDRSRIGMPDPGGDDDEDDETDEGSTILVDCAAGDQIADALQHPAEELTIDIRGICNEDVVITRDQVTLRGIDPDLDGIRGVEQGTQELGAAVNIRGARGINIVNLSISQSPGAGVSVGQSSELVWLSSCRLEDNAVFGVSSRQTSSVLLFDTMVRGSIAAIQTTTGATVSCLECTLTDNDIGVDAFRSSYVFFSESAITANEGAVRVNSRAEVFLWHSTAVGQSAVSALEGGEFSAVGSTLEGGLFGRNDSIVRLNETVKSDASDNLFYSGSTFRLFNQSSVAGNTGVSGFSKFLLQGGASLVGGLYCDDGGDAYCADAGLISGPIVGCSNCIGPGAP